MAIQHRQIKLSVVIFLLALVAYGAFLRLDSPGPDTNIWLGSLLVLLSFGNLVYQASRQTTFERKRKIAILVLSLLSLGCVAGALTIGSISTMFESRTLSSVEHNVGWNYYLWFIVPALLWVILFGYLAAAKRSTK